MPDSPLTIENRSRFAFTPGLPGSSNMDLDRRLGAGEPDLPMVRFYTWAGPTISLGCNQDQARRLRLDLCREDGVGVVRRPTGGREILHGEDLCYSVIWPIRSDKRVEEAVWIFERINEILCRALNRLGVPARSKRVSRRRISNGPCFALIDRGEITAGGRKLVASAQRIYDRVVLQQGSMLLKRPSISIVDYLRINDPKGMTRQLETTTTWLFNHADGTFPTESIVRRFGEEFERFFESQSGLQLK